MSAFSSGRSHFLCRSKCSTQQKPIINPALTETITHFVPGFRLPILAAFRFLQGMARMLDSLAKMDAHHRLLLGFIVAALVGLALRTHALWTASLATYDAFAFAILGLIW
jgi:hypothetical protein